MTPELANAITQVIFVYKRASSNPRLTLIDKEFEKLKKKLRDKIESNTTAQNEHGAEIKSKIRHTKNKYWLIKANRPY